MEEKKTSDEIDDIALRISRSRLEALAEERATREALDAIRLEMEKERLERQKLETEMYKLQLEAFKKNRGLRWHEVVLIVAAVSVVIGVVKTFL